MANKRIALIGLDAADLGLVHSFGPALPVLHEVLGSGRVERLASTAELLTGSIWPTFASGTDPGRHGIYHNLQWDPATMHLRRVSESWLGYEPFWCDLERQGVRATILDVPMSFGPRLARGIEVENWGPHDRLGSFAANRPGLADAIRRKFGSHPMGNEVPVDKTRRQVERIRDDLIEGARRKAELALWLLDMEPWDLFITVFGETHRGGHILWQDGGKVPENALLDVYRAVDQAIGRLLRVLRNDETQVVIFALHGMGPNLSQEHFVAPILDRANEGFGAVSRGSAKQRSMLRLLRERVPARVQHTIAAAVPAAVRDWVVDGSLAGGRHWEETPAFPLHADLNGYVRLNVKDREARGMLDPHDGSLDAYVDWLTSCLESFRDPTTGRRLVREIRLAPDEYPGPRAGGLPDLVLLWEEHRPLERIESPLLGAIEGARATGRGGNHRPDGFFLTLGESDPALSPPRSIVDLAAYAARALGR